jgi:hypothetical protein
MAMPCHGKPLDGLGLQGCIVLHMALFEPPPSVILVLCNIFSTRIDQAFTRGGRARMRIMKDSTVLFPWIERQFLAFFWGKKASSDDGFTSQDDT